MSDNLISVTNNEKNIINLEIIDNNNCTNISFTETINVHNTSSTSHQNIVTDLESKIGLKANNIDTTAALAKKVDIITGKGLSTNDLTDILKANYDTAYTNNHTHNNKTSIDNLISSGDGTKFLTNAGTYIETILGKMNINAFGSTSSNITLTINVITTAAFTSTPTVTLPTICDDTKEARIILDFTTANASYPAISATGTLKWSDKNKGCAPSAYSIFSGVRNRLTFSTIDAGANWEAEYTTYGGAETTFTRPNLSANGTMGGSSFSVRANVYNSGAEAYKAFDASATTYFQCSVAAFNLDIYNQNSLKISSLGIQNYSGGSYQISGGSIYASNDDVNYTYLTAYTNSISAGGYVWYITIPEASRGYYKYYRIANTASSCTSPVVAEISITGTYIAV